MLADYGAGGGPQGVALSLASGTPFPTTHGWGGGWQW